MSRHSGLVLNPGELGQLGLVLNPGELESWACVTLGKLLHLSRPLFFSSTKDSRKDPFSLCHFRVLEGRDSCLLQHPNASKRLCRKPS